MSVQRTDYGIEVCKSADETEMFSVSLLVICKGEYQDRTDALQMIACAWSNAMEVEGLDPLKAIIEMQRQGKLN